jgi:amino acid permease
MMNRNTILIGLLVGLVLPFVGYAILLMIYDGLEAAGLLSGVGFSSNFRQRTLGIVAVCLNLIPLNYFQKRRMTQAMRGLVGATIVYAVGWFVYFGVKLL